MFKERFVNPETIFDTFGTAEADERAQQISDRAVTIVKNTNTVVPLKDADHACLVMMLRGRNSSYGEHLVQEFHKRAPHARALFLDGSLPQAAMEVALGDTSSCSVLVLAAFVNVAAYRGNVALAGDLVPFAQKLTEGSGACGLCRAWEILICSRFCRKPGRASPLIAPLCRPSFPR